MKIKIEMDEQVAEEEVIIRCRGMTEQPYKEQSVRQPGLSEKLSYIREIPSIICR